MSQADVNTEELRKKIAEQAEEIKQLKKQKKFGLVWEDKPDAQVLRVRDETPILCEDVSRAVVTNKNAVDHLLINGDNYHALTALRATHTGKVDVIYIDPPYNTGNKDFIYNDDFLDKEDGYRHSKWLSFMEKRLTLAKEFLADTGVIFVSIDDNEQARLKLLMDEVFGPENFIDSFIWNSNFRPDNSAKFVRKNAEYILTYTKKVTNVDGFAPEKGGSTGLPSLTKNSMKVSELLFHSGQVDFLIPDGDYAKGNLGSYELIDDVTVENGTNSNEFRLKGRIIWGNAKLQQEISEGTKIIIKTTNFTPYTKKCSTRPLPSMKILPPETTKDVLYGRAELARVLGTGIFNYPKPTTLINYLLNFIDNPNAIVLDFFAGSGTTAHAVATLNKEDGGTRQCILVTDGGKTEVTGESSKNANEDIVNIAEEITYERVRRVLTGKNWADGKEYEPLGGNLRYFKVEMEAVASGLTELDQRFSLEKYAVEHAKIAANIFNEVLSKNEFDEETCMLVDYKVFADEVNGRYLVGVNAHDFSLTDLEEWFKSLPAETTIVMVGNGLDEIEWVKKNSDRITVDDVLGRVIRSRKYVASKLPLV